MSFIQLNLTDTQEAKIAPKGRYKLRIVGVEERSKDNEVSGRTVQIEFVEYPDYQNIRHILSFPLRNDEDSKTKTKMRMLRRFLEAFRIPYDANGFQDEDFYGREASIEVDLDSYKADGGQDTTVNRLVLPKLES